MGCVSSKQFKKNVKEEEIQFKNHVVSLISTSYGFLKLDQEPQKPQKPQKPITIQSKKSPPREQEPEIINTWELMSDLEDELSGLIRPKKKSPKSRILLSGCSNFDVKTPLRFLNQMGSPQKLKIVGKENKNNNRANFSPKTSLNNSSRRSLGPIFEREKEQEIIKKMVGTTTPIIGKQIKLLDLSSTLLDSFIKKCPPSGENTVVIYTTTLRGIRKTFNDCNRARSVIESHGVHMVERDISMDSGFKEEVRNLMGTKEVRVPLVFIKGRFIGGVDVVAKLEEEGKLGILLENIAKAAAVCCGCGGFRFVMCRVCSGSCKLMDDKGRKPIKCGECNENGLIHCPICSSFVKIR